MTPQHATYGALVPSYPYLLADELERMALERRNQNLALRTEMHRPNAFLSPGQAMPDEVFQGVKIVPALNTESENTDSEVFTAVAPMFPDSSESAEKPFVINVRPLRQSLEEAYAKAEMNADLDKKYRNVETAKEEPPKSWRHPDNRPEWAGLRRLREGVVDFGDGLKSGATAPITLWRHHDALDNGDLQAKLVESLFRFGVNWGAQNPTKARKLIFNHLANNKAFVAGRTAGSVGAGFATGGLANKIGRTVASRIVKGGKESVRDLPGTPGFLAGANFTMSQKAGAIDAMNNVIDQLKPHGLTLRELPPDTVANLVYAGAVGADVTFDVGSGTLKIEIDNGEHVETINLKTD